MDASIDGHEDDRSRELIEPQRESTTSIGLAVFRFLVGLAATLGGQIYSLMTVLVWQLAVAGRPSLKHLAGFLACEIGRAHV